MKKFLNILLWCSILTMGKAAVGDWTVYPTVSSYSRIEQLGNRYYLLNGNALVVTNVADYADLHTMTRLDGLNGTDIKDICACEALQKLAVVYTDGNMDIIDAKGGIVNLPDYANYAVTGDRSIAGVGVEGEKLYVATGFGGFDVDLREAVIRKTYYDNQEVDQTALAHCREVVNGHIVNESLLKVLESMPATSGTQVQQAAQMRFLHGRLYATQSTYNDYVNYQWGTPVVSILDAESGEWTNITQLELESQVKSLDANATFNRITGIAPSPLDPERIYLSTLEGGIFQLDDNRLTGYYNALLNPDGMTSVLKTNDFQKSRYTRVGALMADEGGYLWFTNGDMETETTLRCLTPEGKFIKYATPGFSGYCNGQYSIIGRLCQSTVSPYRLKWLVRTFHINSAAVCIYYDGGTPEDLSDDDRTMFTTITDQDGNRYNPAYFHDIVEDKTGAMWLLTSIGPFVIDDQLAAFNDPGKVRRIKIPRNDGTNLADYLLNEISCRCIVVDAANRKWIGTDNAGLYLLSADGLTQLEHFTTDNSPLMSNRIAGLTMDDETGTLYIGTDGGICAYETDMLKEVEDNLGVYCYPNPVRANYSGKLNILGFKNGSTVTITDMTHHVVFREKSDGSIIHWNLHGNDGKRIQPGVYHIDAIEEDGRRGGSFRFLVM